MSKRYNVTVNGTVYEVEVEEITDGAAPAPKAEQAPKAAPKVAAPKASAASGTPVNAPMQGTVLKVAVSVGQKVKKGDLVCLLEAMKMENEIFAPCDGTVNSVSVSNGQTVSTGETLVTIG